MSKKKQATSNPDGPAKYFDDQLDGEEMLFMFRKHPIVMRKGLIISSVATLVGPVFTLAWTYLRPENPPTITFFFLSMLASFVLAGLVILPSWITWHFSVYIITDQRFIQITQKGFFTRSVVDMDLRQIQMVNYEVSGLEETLLGFGTIMMQTIVGDLVIHEVHHPDKIQKRLLTVLRAEGITAVGGPINGSDDTSNDYMNDDERQRQSERIQRFDDDEEYERA